MAGATEAVGRGWEEYSGSQNKAFLLCSVLAPFREGYDLSKALHQLGVSAGKSMDKLGRETLQELWHPHPVLKAFVSPSRKWD